MEKVLLLRYGEIYLKGKNRGYFESALLKNIREAINDKEVKIAKIDGRYVVSKYKESDENVLIEKIKKVFGLISLSPAVEIPTSKEEIEKYCASLKVYTTFKVHTTRADKLFPCNSMEFSAEIGGIILDNNPKAVVDIHNPEMLIDIDIRNDGMTFISNQKIKLSGGMPVSTSGRGMLMLSGGIDSPVAGYLMAKRGLQIYAVYFHSHPYTSKQAKQKVVDLAKKLSEYSRNFKLFVVPFTKIQEEIHALCLPEFTITIMRRCMYRIAERLANANYCQCLITGENLAQVASQTVQGITCSNSVLEKLPTFRPLISFDKIEIIEIARKIGTYDISNLPYQDCCTVFVPKNPIIKPKVEKAEQEEKRIQNLDELIQIAVNNTEIVQL